MEMTDTMSMVAAARAAVTLLTKDADLNPRDELRVIDDGAAHALIEMARGLAWDIKGSTTTSLTGLPAQLVAILTAEPPTLHASRLVGLLKA